MVLLERLDFVGLIGLIVQAFLAWVFVAIFATLRRSERATRGFDDFFFAFVVLALSLSALTLRFLELHSMSDPGRDRAWDDGHAGPLACYAAYQGLKVVFGILLVRGSYALAEKPPPRWLRVAGWPLVALFALTPLVFADMTQLLVLQAPVMIASAFFALRALRGVPLEGSGTRVVRWALVGLALAWFVDASAASLHARVDWMRYVLAANSFLDLGVQLSLGTGLVISLLQAAHRRVRVAEEERERLQSELGRDEKLRALGTLLSGVAHELNNPLTVILGYADLLASTDAGNEAARTVAEQAQRCRGIVRNLSALAGQSQHPLQELRADELVLRVVRGIELDKSAGAPSIRVAPFGELRLCADRVGMEQVLANLVTNALHASPRGGCVTLDAASTPAGVALTVADEGAGIARELRARLFEPFYTTKGPGKGLGLGLSIAHAIVRAHGGSISVEDGPGGRGTLFRVLIPHTVVATPAKQPRAAPAVTGRRLLIVDDEPAVRAVVRRQAERRGWTVSEVDSAENALSAATHLAQFDGVLCDLRMPGIGGAGLHDRLRAEHPAVLERTVFVTGDLASPEAVQFSKRCARPLVPKPFEFEELFAILGGDLVKSR